MLKERDLVIKRVMIGCDALTISLLFFATLILRQHFNLIYKLDLIPSAHIFRQPSLSVNDYLAIYFLVVPLWSIALSLNGMYRSMHIRSLWRIAWVIIKSAFWIMVIFGALVFFLKMKFVSRLFFIIFTTLVMTTLMIQKTIIFAFMRRNLERGFNNRRILIFGTGQRAIHLMEKINKHPDWGYEVVKIADYDECFAGNKDAKICEIINSEEGMRRLLHESQIDEAIFIVPRKQLDIIEPYLYICEEEGVDAAIAGDLFNINSLRLQHTDIDGVPLLIMERTFDKEWQLFTKRTFDVIMSGLGIALLSPIFLLSALLVKLTSPGPVFFTQKRVGLHGRIFTMYKFRSMHEGAEKELKKLKSLNEVEGPIFKIKNDPRITPVGKFLRKFSIDELPQLFNVFIGRMSLVGPRPALPDEVNQYLSWERRRLSVRPGITCLWQIYHRSEGDFKKWMQSDLEYIAHWSLSLDLKILTKTLLAVISGRGAY